MLKIWLDFYGLLLIMMRFEYLRSHLFEGMIDLFSPSRGKGKRGPLMFGKYNSYNWIGSQFEIKESGEVVLNWYGFYSPEELWYDSKEHINEIT